MSDREQVIEVIATAALRVMLPVEQGEEVETGVEGVLGDLDWVRHVAIEELGEITQREGLLVVDVFVRLTFHFARERREDVERAARSHLAEAPVVDQLKAFTVESGPYRIESW